MIVTHVLVVELTAAECFLFKRVPKLSPVGQHQEEAPTGPTCVSLLIV